MTSPIPAGSAGLIPHLVCSPGKDAIEFYKISFGAEEIYRLPAPDGKRIMHAELKFADQRLFLADDFPEYCGGKSQTAIAQGGSPITLHRFVEDCDAAIQRAVAAGAKVAMPACDMFWGDRYGSVTDPFGHTWSFGTHQRDLTPEEIAAGMVEAFQQA